MFLNQCRIIMLAQGVELFPWTAQNEYTTVDYGAKHGETQYHAIHSSCNLEAQKTCAHGFLGNQTTIDHKHCGTNIHGSGCISIASFPKTCLSQGTHPMQFASSSKFNKGFLKPLIRPDFFSKVHISKDTWSVRSGYAS